MLQPVMRRWEYRSKLANVFDCYTRLELLFPDEDALIKLAKSGGLQGSGGVMGKELERAFIINALDLMQCIESLRETLKTKADAQVVESLQAQNSELAKQLKESEELVVTLRKRREKGIIALHKAHSVCTRLSGDMLGWFRFLRLVVRRSGRW